MTTYTIQLSDGRTAQVEADEVTTRQSGDLWVLKAVAKPPTPLVPVAIFAARTWCSCTPTDAAIVISGEPRAARPTPTPRAL